MKSTLRMIAGLVAVLGTGVAIAQDIKVGVTLSATGPAASLGIPERNTFPLLPQTIGGKKVNYIVLDDASDTTTAVRNSRKLISEDKVDVLIGSTVTPNSLAMIDVAAESETPMISMAASSRIVDPVDAKTPLGLQDTAERSADGAGRSSATCWPRGSRRSASSDLPTPTAKAGGRSFRILPRRAA